MTGAEPCLAHADALHPANRPGTVSLAQKIEGRWSEKSYRVRELADALPELAGESDVYISTQRFKGWRRISKLLELGALAVDVDFYKVAKIKDMSPLGVLEEALDDLRRNKLPEPTLAIASGRGLALYWLHGPVPRHAIPRWNACQKTLYNALRPLGADRGALDAARVLRLSGTRHSKAGVTVETLQNSGEVWDFDMLAEEVLPVARAELSDLRIQRARRKPAQRPAKPPDGFTAGSLWEARLADIQSLWRLRHGEELPPGERDMSLFLAGVAMSWITHPAVLQRELSALAYEVGGWHEEEAASRLHAVYQRVHMAARGETVPFNGMEVDPRYRFKTETLLEWLEITPEEERHMRTLVGPDERRRRNRERKREERREAGARDRYGIAATNRREAQRLHSEGKSIPEIVEALGVSKRTVHRYLSGGVT